LIVAQGICGAGTIVHSLLVETVRLLKPSPGPTRERIPKGRISCWIDFSGKRMDLRITRIPRDFDRISENVWHTIDVRLSFS
jgi:hypothetical protein